MSNTIYKFETKLWQMHKETLTQWCFKYILSSTMGIK